ncbi:MAG TPA: dephospho-CoA kinase [Actinomycetota bacterium]|nr:dephospho-CoA kinase [Actinomycetota bacterium]
MLLVGLTGGLASGKSTVAGMLGDRGAVVVDADALAREAVAPGSEGLAKVVEEFGPQVLTSDGVLDREKLARIVFEDDDARRRLESIVHPEVFRRLHRRVGEVRDTATVVVFDAALLVETGFDEACDVVVVVDASPERQVERAVSRGGLDPGDAAGRVKAQAGREERRRRADIVVDNSGSLGELEAHVDALWAELSRRIGSG